MNDGSLTHPLHLMVIASCTFLLGLGISPWFWLFTVTFLLAWAVDFMKWALE